MLFFAKLGAWTQKVLLPLGAGGLFAAAILDSSFVTFAGGVDLWLISLSALQPSRMPFYVLSATAGSLIGCFALYFAARKGEEVLLERNQKNSALPRVRQQMESYGSWVLAVAAVLPPPTPFKLFVLAAGLVKHRWERFAVAILAGRLIRYSVEGILAVRYGREAWQWLVRSGPLVMGLVALVVVLLIVRARTRRKARPVEARSDP